MKTHTTNYFNTLITVAVDTKANKGEAPKTKVEGKSIAEMQFDILINKPYKYNSDEVLVHIFAERNEFTDMNLAKEVFFSKGQACLRTSPLAKTYGWGIHFNKEGRIALYGMETLEYENLLEDKTLDILPAMRSKSL